MSSKRCAGCNGSSINLCVEENRLVTFKESKLAARLAAFFAKQGFYYAGNSTICCQFCGIICDINPKEFASNSGWRETFISEHYQSSDCDLMKNRQCGNVPLDHERESALFRDQIAPSEQTKVYA